MHFARFYIRWLVIDAVFSILEHSIGRQDYKWSTATDLEGDSDGLIEFYTSSCLETEQNHEKL
jgi:hypothetical protein